MSARLLKTFGTSDAWFRGTALACNLSYWAIVALVPGYGADGLLFSGSVQLLISGLLEIPTSLLADCYGRFRSVKLGLALKFAVTSAFAISVTAAMRDYRTLAWAMLCAEAVIDSFANAFLSGAYQAAYSDWYRSNLRDVDGAPAPLFLASFRYGLWIRLGIPLGMMGLGSAALVLSRNTAATSWPFVGAVIGCAFMLRLVVFWRISRDLEGMNDVEMASARIKMSPLKKSISFFRGELVLYAFGSFLALLISLFFIGYVFRALQSSGVSPAMAWAGGMSVGIGMNLVSVVAGRLIFPRIKSKELARSFLIGGSLCVAVTAIVGIITILTECGPLLQALVIFIFASVANVTSRAIQSSVSSSVLDQLPSNCRATWVSLAEVLGYLGSSGVFLLMFFSSHPENVAVSLLSLSASLGALVGIRASLRKNGGPARDPASINSFLGRRFFVAAMVLALSAAAFDIYVFRSTLWSLTLSNREYGADLAAASLREPIIQGSFIEAKSRLQRLVDGGKAACIAFEVWGENVSTCGGTFADSRKYGYLSRDLRFGSQGSDVVAKMRIYFDNADLHAAIIRRVCQSVALCLCLGALLLIFLRSLSRRVNEEASTLVKILKDQDERSFDDTKFRLREFKVLAEELSRVFDDLSQATRDSAIAKTTSMLAHDVRKPFSMLKVAMDMIERAKSPADISRVVKMALPEVRRAIESVNGMIQDIMEIGSQRSPIRESTRVATLIEVAVTDAVRIHPRAELSFSYQMSHTKTVVVESQKVLRVFSNILGNAIQAMDRKGAVWIETQDSPDQNGDWVEFRIGNAGSLIEAEDLPKLFHAFFSKGKKGGTGLGLAISQKIVSAHGGKIRCESGRSSAHPDGYVIFVFTLPAGEMDATFNEALALPTSSAEIHRRFALPTIDAEEVGAEREAEVKVEHAAIKSLESLRRKMKVLLVDDEAVYRNALLSAMTSKNELATLLDVSESSAAYGIEGEASCYDLVILDVDLGSSSPNGFDLCRQLRSQDSKAFICIHSNRILAGDHRLSTEAGADAFLPKPLPRVHVLKLLAQAAERAAEKKQERAFLRDGGNTCDAAAQDDAVCIALVDDSLAVRMAWKNLLSEVNVLTFESPEAFWLAYGEGRQDVEKLSCVVTDYNFGQVSKLSGKDFAQELSARCSRMPVFVASEGDYPIEHFDGTVTGLVSKDPLALPKLGDLLKKTTPRAFG